ncbi:MAG TPA: hypothetical protein VFC99_14885 [Acidimicrobiia bacterium]|nr:hypothetical protein [Acidimicrobiia bacterium]
MSTFTATHDRDVDGPGFDRRRLAPEHLPRILELTSTLCAVNAELSSRSRPVSLDPRAPRPSAPPELVDRRRMLLDELHQLIDG